MESQKIKRRDVLKGAAIGGIALVTNKSMAVNTEPEEQTPAAKGKTMKGVPFERFSKIRVGLIGVGARGSGLLNDLLAIEDVEVKALCDIDKAAAERNKKRVTDKGQPEPAMYTAGPRDYENLCKRDDIDLVYIATPWDWHTPMAVFAMEHGKHVGVEVPAAVTLKDCWLLVDTSEKTRKHCVMLENCCYGYNEMMVLNMVRAGLFGELTHGEAAYIHDLRSLLVENYSEGLWRRKPHTERNGNFYPTHGLGPVAQYMDVHHGDAFDVIVSLSSPELGLTKYVAEHFPEGDPKRKEDYIAGDMNTSIIKTKLGRTIMLQHDVISPRPYTRHNMISGTKGTFADYPARIFIDGQKEHEWQSIDPFKAKYEHPLWTNVGELARKLGGHGGMDFIMSYRLIQCMKEGKAPDMDVYDAAAWSAPTPLSQDSVKKNGAPQKFPDFTRGLWNRRL